jgi:FkbM family methyltransferase
VYLFLNVSVHKKIRVALLIFGRLDQVKFTYQSLIEALGSNSVTTYISSDNASQEECDLARRLYNPEAFDNTPKLYDGRWDNLNNRNDTNVSNMFKHLTNKKRVFELVLESGKEFDVYVCCRADLYFTKSFPLVIDDSLHVPLCNDHFGLNDQCAWGGKIAVERYATMIDRAIEINDSFNDDKMFNPEVLTKRNMEPFHVKREEDNYCFKCRCIPIHLYRKMKPLMIEVGGFDGGDSLMWHQRGYDVISFEPKRDLAAALFAKTAELPNFTVVPKAVSNVDGKTMFNECKRGGASSILPFKSDDELIANWTADRTDIHYNGTSYEVDVTRLDTYIRSVNLHDRSIDYLHVDAQGVDLEVLEGLGDLVANVKAGVVETVKDTAKAIYVGQSNTLEKIEKFLSDNGFAITRVEGNDCTGCEYNVFFEKK